MLDIEKQTHTNTDEVLKGLGYTDEQIAAFAKNGTTAPLPNGQM